MTRTDLVPDIERWRDRTPVLVLTARDSLAERVGTLHEGAMSAVRRVPLWSVPWSSRASPLCTSRSMRSVAARNACSESAP
mgnify:CR=1 FL=1